MPLLLNEDDILPVGIHEATLAEFETCFGCWIGSDQRPTLFRLFTAYIDAVRFTGWDCVVIADGSYVMKRVKDPEDIDVVIGYPPEAEAIIESENVRPFQKNVVDPWYCKRTYRIDLKPCLIGGQIYQERVEFFQRVSMKRADQHRLSDGSRKGLVRIIL